MFNVNFEANKIACYNLCHGDYDFLILFFPWEFIV